MHTNRISFRGAACRSAIVAWSLVAGIGTANLPGAAHAQAIGPAGDFQRAILVSWDGVKRETLHELLEVADPSEPCWGGDSFPVDTGRVDAQGQPIYTCLPTLAGLRPADAPEGSPAYAPFQMIACHTTNDGNTMTKPQHASMLTGLNTETHGLPLNNTKGAVEPGVTIYEYLMNTFDPANAFGDRDETIFRTVHAGSKKYVGRSITRWAKKNDALQIATSAGNDSNDRPGGVRKARKYFERWKRDEIELGRSDTDFFAFFHFKSPDWSGHRAGVGSNAYRRQIVRTDRKLYELLELLRSYGWSDTAVLVTTDHGFHKAHHGRSGGRHVFNTWLAAYNVELTVDHIPMRTAQDYCASHSNPEDCLTNGPEVPMPPEDVVPNVILTALTPTLLDMYGVEWRTSTPIEGVSLYVP